jgi:pimeloyl-ACP methyl ester carboxylesterase
MMFRMFPDGGIMQRRTIDARGSTISFLDAGEGPLVLLCHGFPETAYAWRHQIAALSAAGYRAIAPDLRGYGDSLQPDAVDAYTVLHAVGDLVGLLDALEVPHAAIVGGDWGATVAWQAALMQPDRFRAVAALGVPLMENAPMPPTRLFPSLERTQFYTLYFQDPGVAEQELERDIRTSLRKIYFAASGDAGPRRPGDDTPNPFGMVSRLHGLLNALPDPDMLPAWLTDADLDIYTAAFERSGFRGGLNYYRNLDRNWELQRSLHGLQVTVPALFAVGERDPGLQIPGMEAIIGAMPRLAPDLRDSIVVPGAGHWLQQERPDAVSQALLDFLVALPH